MNKQLCPNQCNHICCDRPDETRVRIGKQVFVEFTPSANEMAQMFWGEMSDYQAEFFNELGKLSGNRLCFQLQHVTDEEGLTNEGRRAMRQIGDYADTVQKDVDTNNK